MIKIYNIQDIDLADILARENQNTDPKIQSAVAEIVDNVAKNGDKALYYYSEKFDKVVLNSFKVDQNEIQSSINAVGAPFLQALQNAKENIIAFHKKQLNSGFEITNSDGSIVGQRIIPLQSAGLYVPGGTACYPSSVLMNALPAKIAGVENIIIVTPPQKDGKIDNKILAAAHICGIDQVYKIGGAQAVSALAYGTESIPKVDKIVGPGNIYVATAKKQVFGICDIDMIAGPSEILIIADKDNNADFIAADMLSQAEHDTMATAVLITDSEDLAKNVAKAIEEQLKNLPRQQIATASIKNYGKIIVVPNIAKAIEVANIIAPEHLEVCLKQPFDYLKSIKNAGSVFLGQYTPEAVGDYLAGTNHTLPTGGTARFFSPLSVDDFQKKSQYVYYTKQALQQVANDICTIANEEGLHAHANSVTIRTSN